MTVPDFTPFAGLLPTEADPATFPTRAQNLFSWFTQTGAPQLAALSQFLGEAVGESASVLEAVHALQMDMGGTLVPVGAVMPFALTAIPEGWLPMDGRAVTSDMPDLRQALLDDGAVWGMDANGDPLLADLRGEFVRGWDQGRGVDADRAFGAAQGDEIRAHSHQVKEGSAAGGGTTDEWLTSGDDYASVVNSYSTTTETGGAETRPRNVALIYAIKAWHAYADTSGKVVDLGTAAAENVEAFATAEQGARADEALARIEVMEEEAESKPAAETGYVATASKQVMGILDVQLFSDLCTIEGQRNWYRSEDPGTVAMEGYAVSELIPVSAGTWYRVVHPTVANAPVENVVAFYTDAQTPVGSLLHSAFGAPVPGTTKGEAAAAEVARIGAWRSKQRQFRVEQDGFIRVSARQEVLEAAYLVQITQEAFAGAHELGQEEILRAFLAAEGLRSPVMTTLGSGFAVDSTALGRKSAISDFLPVSAGQYINVLTTASSYGRLFSFYDSDQALVGTFGNVHGVQALPLDGLCSLVVAENVVAPADGYIRIVSQSDTDGVPVAQPLCLISEDRFDWPRPAFAETGVLARHAGAALSGLALQKTASEDSDVIGPIHVRAGEILRLDITQQGPVKQYRNLVISEDLETIAAGYEMIEVPHMGLLQGTDPTALAEQPRFVFGGRSGVTVWATTAPGTGAAEILSYERFREQRDAALANLQPVYGMQATVGAMPYGVEDVRLGFAGIGFIPMAPGEVITYRSNRVQNFGHGVDVVDGVPNDATFEMFTGPFENMNVTYATPGTQHLVTSRWCYAGLEIAGADQAAVSDWFAGAPIRIRTLEEWRADGINGDVEIGIVDGHFFPSFWDEDNTLTYGGEITALEGVNCLAPLPVLAGQKIYYEGNAAKSSGNEITPVILTADGIQPLIDGPITSSATEVQRVAGYYEAPEDCYLIVNQRALLESDTVEANNQGILIEEQTTLEARFVTDEVYARNMDLFEGRDIIVGDPAGMSFVFYGRLPSDVSDARTPTRGIMQIRKGGSLLAVFTAELEIQGQSTATRDSLRKNFTMKGYNAAGKKIRFKFGDWKQTSKFVLKSYDSDMTRVRDTVCTDIWRQVRRARSWPDNMIWDPRLLEQVDAYHTASGATDAVCSTQGVPIDFRPGDSSVGVYTLRTKKDEPNYVMQEDNLSHIMIESDYKLNSQSITWDAFAYAQWEIRAPGIDGYEPGEAMPDPTVAASVERVFNWIAACCAGTEDFAATCDSYLYMPSWIDYFVTFQLIHHTDGSINNVIMTTHDALRWSIQIYDCDWTLSGAGDGLLDIDNGSPLQLLWENAAAEIQARWGALRGAGVITPDAMAQIVIRTNNGIADEWRERDWTLFGRTDGTVYHGAGPTYLIQYFHDRIAELDGIFGYTA